MVDILPKIKGKYRINADLSKMCWFGVGGAAEILFIPYDLQDLQDFLLNKPSSLPIQVIGIGSNLLIRDAGVKGVTIRLGRGFNCITHKENIVTVGAATLDVNLAIYAQQFMLSGLEFFIGIPGTVGGALAMNAGAYGYDTASVLIEAQAINIITAEIRSFKVEEINYTYRAKALPESWIFTEAKFLVNPGNDQEIAEKMQNIQSKRNKTQPIKSKTSGSTFKNPLPHRAWQLIDEARCRGLKVNDAQVSPMHCNFFINNGGATANDIEQLIEEVRARVYMQSKIYLDCEIKIIGQKI